LLSRRDALTADERTRASARIAEAANELLETRVGRGGVLAIYRSKGTEVDTTAIDQAARARGVEVAYPRVVDGQHQLAFHLVGIDELLPSRFGLREPRTDARGVAIDRIAAFVIPGLAFDRSGARLGWGLGHYDATLALASPGALRVGLAFECQMVESVPHEAHDQLLHVIITEVATHVA
jgi:5-formyltetrahydrofolate cyclo-ligase